MMLEFLICAWLASGFASALLRNFTAGRTDERPPPAWVDFLLLLSGPLCLLWTATGAAFALGRRK